MDTDEFDLWFNQQVTKKREERQQQHELQGIAVKQHELYDLAVKQKWEELKSILEKEPHRINETGGLFGRTLAYPAIQQGNFAIIEYLAAKKLDFQKADMDNYSTLHWAAHCNNEAIVKYLLVVQKADLNLQRSDGWTPLHCAAEKGHMKIVNMLVMAGASLGLKSKKGRTASDVAKQEGKEEVFNFLSYLEQLRGNGFAAITPSQNNESERIKTLESKLENQIAQTRQMKEEYEAELSMLRQQIEQARAQLKSAESATKLLKATVRELETQVQLSLAAIPFQQLKAIKVLGKGATAEVSLVEWQSKQYAFKCFHDEETASMCLKEASVAMSLSCPYIVHIYGKTEEPAGMLVEYMNKGSLFTVLFKSKLALSPSQKKQIALAVGNALSFMHERNVLHRDVKADNVLLHGNEDNSELHAKVADFGTAKLLSTRMTSITTGSSAFTGTLSFMAPELLNGAIAQIQADLLSEEPSTVPSVTATKGCDVYSFGVLLYELICEKQAYQGLFFPSAVRFMKHVASGKRPEIPNACPSGWQILIEKCWHQDPTVRPSMKEVLEELEKL